jgi:hypothetical protein
MSRGPQTFRQRDLLKAIKVAHLAGMSVAEIRVDKDGAHIVTVAQQSNTTADKDEANEWDRI